MFFEFNLAEFFYFLQKCIFWIFHKENYFEEHTRKCTEFLCVTDITSLKAFLNVSSVDKIDANALLGFNAAGEEEDSGFKGKKRYEQNQKVQL